MKNTIFFSDENKQFQKLKPLEFEYNPTAEWKTLNIHTDLRFQQIYGFGGAFTEAAAITFSKMSQNTKDEFIKLAFDKNTGLGYNFCRSTINSCDFSASEYTYVDDNDEDLKSFDISHDKKDIIPMIKAAKNACDDLFLLSSPWSPPDWMKDSGVMIEGGKLKHEYYGVWADYFVKFVSEYKKAGVDVNAVTIQNEPMAAQTWESCQYTINEQIEFAKNYLHPAFLKADLDTKIFIWDHNKEHVYEVARAIKKVKDADKSIYGIAFHWYSGEHFDGLTFAHETAPNLKLIASEFCHGGLKPIWNNALKYAFDISGNLNNFMSASCDWNILLDENGGPYNNRTTPCQAVMHYDTKSDKITIMPQYYAVKHFSSFIKKGAVRLGTSTYSGLTGISAFKNPNGEIVAVITCKEETEQKCILRFDDYAADIIIKPKSIMTIVINN